MVLVLCYDVVADGRRARLFKGLKGYLRPVQKSVFEGRLPERRWDPMIRMVSRIIEPAEDSVRIYRLCAGCAGVTTHLGVSALLPDPAEPVIV
jgi:CRISPR-associated protein Cas2